MASPLTIQPGGAAGKDTYIDSCLDSNSGGSAYFYVGDESSATSQARRDLIAFDVSGVPAGSIITSAALSLWEPIAASASGGPASWAVELRRVLRNWVEAESTWSTYSTGNNWATAGCDNATDRVDAACASLTMDGTAANAFVTWSGAGLVAVCQGWLDGTFPNYGLLLSAPTTELLGAAPRAYNAFYSSDDTDAATRPKLVLEYTVPPVLLAAIGNIALAGSASLEDGIRAIGTIGLDEGYADLTSWEPMAAVGTIALCGEAWLSDALHGDDTLQAIGTIMLRCRAVRLSTGEVLPPTDDLGWTEP